MAKIGTNVARAWDALRERLADDAADVDTVRAWWRDVAASLSPKLRARYESTCENPIWRAILARSPAELPTTRDAWNEMVAELERGPPRIDPHAVFEWGLEKVWALSVFEDPDDFCDEDEYELELWWSERDGRPLFSCGFGHELEFQVRTQEPGMPDLEPWRGRDKGLVPADRDLVTSLYPEADLMPVDDQPGSP